MQHEELPLGFGMALAKNPEAMQKFATLSETEKQEILRGTHAMQSKEDMQRYVNSLFENPNTRNVR